MEAGAEEALQGMLNCLEPDPCDRKERELIVRAILALAPDGWRGIDHGLQDKARKTIPSECHCEQNALCGIFLPAPFPSLPFPYFLRFQFTLCVPSFHIHLLPTFLRFLQRRLDVYLMTSTDFVTYSKFLSRGDLGASIVTRSSFFSSQD